MPVQADISVGWKKESAYGTAVTVDRWAPVAEESLTYATEWKQGTGLMVGAGGVALASGYYPTIKQGSGDFAVELRSKGLGTLLELLMGSATSTTVSGATYQQLFTLGALPSATIQRGLVFGDAADGTRDQQTFKGCVSTGFEIAVPNAEQATIKTSWDIRDYDTTTAYAAPSYPTYSQAGLMHWGQAALTLGGTLTAPTTTALGSIAGGAAGSNVRSWNLKVTRTIDTDRFNMVGTGLKSLPLTGVIEISGSMEVEHTDGTLRAAAIAGTVQPMLLTMTTTEALSTGFSQFQVALPGVTVSGFPVSNSGSLPVTQYEYSGKFAEGAAQPIYIATRTSDTAL